MNLRPLLNDLSIVNKRGLTEKFQLNWAQEEYLAEVHKQWNKGRPVRIIVLKARQLGISTVTQGILFTMSFIFQNTRAMTVGNEIDNAQHLLSMSDTYWQTYPYKALYTQKYASRNEIAWNETGSSIRVATAKNAKAGRGKTIRALHASECAFWDYPEKVMLSMRQAIPEVPDTFIALESTANGVGNYFYETWQLAEQGDIDFVPLFFPWHRHPEYMASYIGLDYQSLSNLDGEERSLRNIGISDDRLSWRRWAIKNLCGNDLHQFHQEYPTTPEEAFVATGTNVFPVGKLRECYEPSEGQVGRLVRENNEVRFQPDISGPLRIFRWPSKDRDWGVYFVSGDPTHTTRGDYAVGQVISRRTLEQVAVFRQRIDPGTFATQLALLGEYYNDAMIAAEAEGPGYMTIGRLIEMQYPSLWYNKVADKTPGKHNDHFGWRTNVRSKELAISWLLKLVVDKQVLIHDANTFKEMRDYVTLSAGGYGPANGTDYDDTVMSFAIGVTAHLMEPPLMPYTGPGGNMTETPTWEAWGEGTQ